MVMAAYWLFPHLTWRFRYTSRSQPLHATIMAVAWERLIRFVTEDGRTLRGEPILLGPDFDLGSTTESTRLQAKVIEGDDVYDTSDKTVVTNGLGTIKHLLGPLSQADLPILRCVGLNYAEHILEAGRKPPPSPFIF